MTDENTPGMRVAPYLLGAMVVAAIAMLLLSWTDNSTELTPNHEDNTVAMGLWVAAAASAITLTLVLWLKVPLRGPKFIMAPLLALPVGLLAGLLAFSLSDRLWQTIDFAGGSTRGERQFLIARAYVSHGKGVRYHIQLSEYFADLNLSPEDYTQAFGVSEEVRPIGYCLHAPIEQNRTALRIMYSSARAIPVGHVGRCS